MSKGTERPLWRRKSSTNLGPAVQGFIPGPSCVQVWGDGRFCLVHTAECALSVHSHIRPARFLLCASQASSPLLTEDITGVSRLMSKNGSTLGSWSASFLTVSDALLHVRRSVSLFSSLGCLVFSDTLSQDEKMFVCYLLRHCDDNHCVYQRTENLFPLAIKEHCSQQSLAQARGLLACSQLHSL